MNSKKTASIRSLKTAAFDKAFEDMPKDIQKIAVEKFKAWRDDPTSLHMKPMHAQDLWSAEINHKHRALGVRGLDAQNKTTYVWFWVGSHEDYNKLVSFKQSHSLSKQILNIRQKYLSGPAPTADKKHTLG